MTAPTLDLYRVLEGPDLHVVIASSPEQARGIAFGHRFSDDEPDREWPVHRADHLPWWVDAGASCESLAPAR